jgi:hypothetical protein
MRDPNFGTLATLRELCREFVLDKRYKPPLRIANTVDIALRNLNGPVTREQLNVAKRTTCIMNDASRAGDECSPSRVGGAALEPHSLVCAGEPDHDGERLHSAATVGRDNRSISRIFSTPDD